MRTCYLPKKKWNVLLREQSEAAFFPLQPKQTCFLCLSARWRRLCSRSGTTWCPGATIEPSKCGTWRTWGRPSQPSAQTPLSTGLWFDLDIMIFFTCIILYLDEMLWSSKCWNICEAVVGWIWKQSSTIDPQNKTVKYDNLCFSPFYIILNEIYLGFVLLVRQNKMSSWAPWNCVERFSIFSNI